MKYFPILQELFESDTVLFFIMGLIIAVVIGLRLSSPKKLCIGAGISVMIYLVCELVSNIHTNFMAELILLFFGTIAMGGVIGFVIALFVALIRNRKAR